MLIYENREDYFSVMINSDAIRKEKDCRGDKYLGKLFESMYDSDDIDAGVETTISVRNLYIDIYIRTSYTYNETYKNWEFGIYTFNSESEFPNNFPKWSKCLADAISSSNKLKKISIQKVFKKSIKAMFKKS